MSPLGADASADARPPRAAPPWKSAAAVMAGCLALGGALLLRPAGHQVRSQLQLAAFGTAAERLEARTHLLASPRESAPVLVRILLRSKERWRTEILPWLEPIPQVANLRSRHLRLERAAIDLLQQMGPETAPELLPLLSADPLRGRDTGLALIRSLGPAACPFLIGSLSSSEPKRRAEAALALGKFPADTPGTLDSLRSAARDPAPEVRAAVLWALGQFQDRGEELLPEILRGIGDPTPAVRLQAIRTLRHLGPVQAAPAAVSALRPVLTQGNTAARVEAATALANLGPSAAEAAPELVSMLRDSSLPVTRQAALTLVALQAHETEALEALARLLARSDAASVTRTLEMVGELGAKAADLVPGILALLENRSTRDDRAAVMALRRIAPEAVPPAFRRRSSPPSIAEAAGPTQPPPMGSAGSAR